MTARYRSIKRANERIDGLMRLNQRVWGAKVRAEGQEARLREALTTIREDCRDALHELPDPRIRRMALTSAINVVDETLGETAG